MSNHKDKLHVLGRASSVVVRKLQRDNEHPKENTIWLFVGYSFSPRKVGDSFDIFIKESDQSWNHDYRIKLRKIYDEFGRAYTVIPEGYKTMCMVECVPSIPAHVRTLPTLKTWDATDRSIYLCNHEDIDLLQDASLNTAAFDTLSKMVLLNLRSKKKTKFTMKDLAGALPDNTPQLIIDNLFLTGALRKNEDEYIYAV